MSAELLTALQAGPEAGALKSPGAADDLPEQARAPEIPGVLSILPVRGFVVFPGTVAPLNVRRAGSIKLIDETLPGTKIIGLVAQRDENKEEPGPLDLYEIGTAAIVLKLLRQADDHIVAVVQGLRRFSIQKIVKTEPFLQAEIKLLESVQPPPSKEWEATFRNLRDSAAQLLDLTSDVPDQAGVLVRGIENPEQLVDFLAPNLNVDVAQKQSILEELNMETRLRAVQTHISAQLEIAQIQQKLQKDVQSRFSDAQRKAYLREQLKAIQRELGESDGGADEQVAQLRTRLEQAKPPADIMAQADRELKRVLWRKLRNRKFSDHKFRRQHPLDPYILDFYCPELLLAIELDGGGHNEVSGKLHDRTREKFLADKGIKVLRFWNHQLRENIDAVMEIIWLEVEKRKKPSP